MGYVLGIDGGGTKTDCVLMDETRAVLARTLCGPSNPSRVGLHAALLALVDAAEQAVTSSAKSAAEIAAIHAGIAGIEAARAIDDLARQLKLKFPNANILIESDLSMALAATQEIPSVVVIAGTGSAVIGRDSGEHIARDGGLGPILGDPASAYDIGRRAAALGLRQHLRGEDSGLANQIPCSFNCDWAELQEKIRLNADSVLPKIFPIVTGAANRGDDSARELLRTAAVELSELVARVVERLALQQQPFFLAKTGGVFNRSPVFDDQFDALVHKIAPNARIGPLPEPLAVFAARTALQSLSSPLKSVGK